MVVLKGWEASIVVGGQKLREYDEPDAEAGNSSFENVMTKYVEAVSGRHFSITLGYISELPPGDSAYDVEYFVDGALADHLVQQPKGNSPIHRSVKGILKCAHGKWNLQRFRFAAIIHDENQNAIVSHPNVSSIAKLGKIEIEIYGTKIIDREKDPRTTWNENSELSEFSSIPEKALKGSAKSHHASLDAPEPHPARNIVQTCKLNPEQPDVTFVFKYRSHRALQTEGVIPRSPSPLPLEDRPEESLSREELLELLRRRPKPTKAEVKPDHSAGASVKRERDPEVDEILSSARARKIGRKDADIEVIDLLDD